MEGKYEPELRGIIPNAFSHIFSNIDSRECDMQYLIRISYLEI